MPQNQPRTPLQMSARLILVETRKFSALGVIYIKEKLGLNESDCVYTD